MTTSGFQTFNDNGALQFDANATGFYFVGKGTTTTVAGSALIQIDNLPTFDTIALSCDTAPVKGEIGFTDINSYKSYAKLGTHTVKYWLFRSCTKLDPSTLPKVGLELYDSNGDLTYHSSLQILRIALQSPTTSLYSGMSEFVSLPTGKTYAYMSYGLVVRMLFPPANYDPARPFYAGTSPNTQFHGARNTTNGFYKEEHKPPFNFGYTAASIYNGGILVADVTGL